MSFKYVAVGDNCLDVYLTKDAMTVGGNARMLERHNIAEPADLMLAQYSIPFCVALALYREARDPESFDEGALTDPHIRALCRRVALVPKPVAARRCRLR